MRPDEELTEHSIHKFCDYNRGMDEEDQIDEVATNVLLLNDVDLPTALAGSLNEPRSDPKVLKSMSTFGAIAALIVALFLLYIWTSL